MPPLVDCIFCGSRAPRAKEHVFPTWLLQDLNVDREPIDLSHHSPTGELLSRRRHDLDSFQFGKVCADCNHGWMSRLETEARRIFGSLWRHRRRVPCIDAWALSLWTLKTSCVLNAAANYRRIIPSAHARLVRGLQLPLSLYVDVAYRRIPWQLSWSQSQQIVAKVAPEHLESVMENLRRECYSVTLGFGHLLLRAVYVPVPGYKLSEVSHTPSAQFCRLWPLRTHMYPKPRFPFDELETFVKDAVACPIDADDAA